jgi:hypothetical protein
MKCRLYLVLMLMLIPAQSYACISTKEQMQEWFDTHDQDADKQLNMKEYFKLSMWDYLTGKKNIFEEAQKKHFGEIDSGKDGTISFDEYFVYKTGPGREKCH